MRVLGSMVALFVTHYTFYGGQLALTYQTDSATNTMLFDPAEHE